MPIKILALIPMSINSDQCRSIPINSNQFCNDRHWEAFRINAMTLIAIERHWSALCIDRGSLENSVGTCLFISYLLIIPLFIFRFQWTVTNSLLPIRIFPERERSSERIGLHINSHNWIFIIGLIAFTRYKLKMDYSRVSSLFLGWITLLGLQGKI